MYVASQLFAVRAAEKNIKKARHERCPCADESAQRCSKKRWQATRHVPAAHESHKLEHHDQWARFRFRKAKAVHHLTRLQPVKITSGKGTLRKKIATKATAARLHIITFLRAFEPMRITASATIAMTAGFTPKKIAATQAILP